MDDSIAPVQGSDPVAAYRAYLEANTGYRAGAGPATPDAASTPPMGAGAQIAPVDPSAAPQSAPQIAPMGEGPTGGMPPPGADDSTTPALDGAMPNPVQTAAPQAPQADQAPLAPKAKKADKLKGARQAAQAPQIAPANPNAQPPSANADAITTDDSQMTPASGHVIKGKTTDDGRPLINVQPPDHDPSDFDKDKLQDAHTVDDVFNALPAAKRSSYMDWWQQQHGDINQRYDQMRQDLGMRPDPNREPSRQEKFTELMNFGLNLLRNAKRGNDPMAAMGTSAQEALQTQKDKQQGETSAYDQRAAAIEAQRQNQLKDIGNYGQATREDALIQDATTRTAIAQANAAKPPKANQPTTRVLKNGQQIEYDATSKSWKVSVDQDGKPLPAMNPQGPRGGASGGSKQLELIQGLEQRGYSTADAVNNVLHVKPSGDPFHDYVSVLNKNTPQGATAEEKAEAASMAQETIDHMYGAGALDAARAKRNQAINGPGAAPPTSTLKSGVITKFKNGQRWTLGQNGQPQQVQ